MKHPMSMADVHEGADDAPKAETRPASGAERRGTRRRLKIYAVIAPLLVLLVLWVYLFYEEGAFNGGPGGKAFAADYAMFVSAAQLLKAGTDPYNPAVLVRTETAMMHHLHRTTIKRSQRGQVRVGNPPILYWAMQPLVRADFTIASLVTLAGLYVLSAVGFLATLQYFGWRNRVLPLLVFLFMPQVVLGVFYGNPIGIVFAAIGAGLLLSRRHPAVAGAIMCLAWLKPPVALPVVLLLALFHVERPLRFAAGFGIGTIALFALTLLTSGMVSVGWWVHGLLRYSNDMAIQPDVISLSGLYVRWMPSGPRLVLEAATLLGALALTAYLWRRSRTHTATFVSIAPLWFVWILAAPYGHFFDEILLAVPMAAFLGQGGQRVASRAGGTALYLFFFSLFLISLTPGSIYLLPIPLIAIGTLIARSSSDPRFATP